MHQESLTKSCYLSSDKPIVYESCFDINVRGLVDTLVRTYWRLTDTTKEVFIIEYNSAGNPNVITKGGERFLYYYEDFTTALSAKNETVASPTSILYPNLANSRVFMRSSEIHSITIVVMSERVLIDASYSAKGIDVGELPPGVYIAKLIGRGGVQTCRFMKQ